MAGQRETKQYDINGTTYSITQLGADNARKVAARLMKVNFNHLALSDEDYAFVKNLFAASTEVHLGDKRPQLSSIFDAHFAGDFSAQCNWMACGIEANYEGFLLDLKAERLRLLPASVTS